MHSSQLSAMSNEERISSKARSHPLFPILQHIAVSVRNCKIQIESIDTRTKKIEQDLNSVVSVQRELHELMKEHHKKAWNVKDAGFDVSYANNCLIC